MIAETIWLDLVLFWQGIGRGKGHFDIPAQVCHPR